MDGWIFLAPPVNVKPDLPAPLIVEAEMPCEVREICLGGAFNACGRRDQQLPYIADKDLFPMVHFQYSTQN